MSLSDWTYGPTVRGSTPLRVALLTCALTIGTSPAHAGPTPSGEQIRRLKQLSIEQLMNVVVTSVTRTPQPLVRSAAAVAVVTSNEIRRSGATNIPEAIRYVPGLNVSQITASQWAVSSRGFASADSPDLLVLSDGRNLYTPLFSGVFWDVQDYLMRDIDRIEVIRGPGAALWGSNAVNGVINIITKNAKETQGSLFEAGSGTEERARVAAQYGGETANRIYYRVFAKYQDHGAEQYPPSSGVDDWRLGHAGLRADWKADTADALTVQGDLYGGRIGQVSPAVIVAGRPGPAGPLVVGVSGGNILGHWRHAYGAGSDFELRVYYDYTHRNDPAFLDDLSTFDVDFQDQLPLGAMQSLTWGLTVRTMYDHNLGKGLWALNPPNSRDNLESGFIQDVISLPSSVRVTLGTKLEHNDFSGFEAQPSVRAAWSPSQMQTLWGAISRAVRVPTRLERDVNIALNDPTASVVFMLLGNRNFKAEQVLAYELGYRWQPLGNLSLDLAVFRNRYTGLASLEAGTPFVDPATGQLIVPVKNRNLVDGHSIGAESEITYAPLSWWRVSLSYSYLDMTLTPLGQDLNHERYFEGATPLNQFGLQSYFDLPHRIELFAGLRAVSAIRTLLDAPNGDPGYQELDVHASWRATRHLELSLEGRSLLHAQHVEFAGPGDRSGIRRSVFGRMTWRF